MPALVGRAMGLPIRGYFVGVVEMDDSGLVTGF